MADYDYIIVGGGSAGCVLANRLSADPANRVCLLEAGPRDWSPFIKIPLGIIALMRSKTFNWAYHTEPQKNLDGRRLFWPRGKTLGGSSAINAMCYIRGNPRDYDAWEAEGNPGWGYADLLPWFRACENFEGGEDRFHGTGGGYNVSTLRNRNRLSEVFLEAARECGYADNHDFCATDDEGFGWYHVAQKDGQRCSNAHGFLHPVRDRENLTVLTRTRALKVLLEGKRAVGVVVKKGRRVRPFELRADKEVILAGGAVNSPQLLLLSGIGDKAEIEPHGIALQHQLPGVGRNLQDHLDVTLIHREATRHSVRLHPVWLLTKGVVALWQYLFHRRGQLTSNIAECGGFVKLDPTDANPSLQCHFLAAIEQDHGHKLINTIKYHGYSLRICDLHPLSRGRIRLHSALPSADARIEPNYLDQKRDLERLVAAVKVGRKLLDADAFAPYRRDEFRPGAELQDDADIHAFIRAEAESIYHPVGSCKMGPDPAAGAVVDARLKVHGLQGLRVVDASIMPTLNGGNTNAITSAIAAKGAAMILEDAASLAGVREAA